MVSCRLDCSLIGRNVSLCPYIACSLLDPYRSGGPRRVFAARATVRASERACRVDGSRERYGGVTHFAARGVPETTIRRGAPAVAYSVQLKLARYWMLPKIRG